MRTKPISETKTMTDFTTGQFIDAVTNIKDAFLNIKKENDDLIETNKYLVMEIKRLESDLLQMTLEKKDGKLVSREAKKEAEKKEKEAKKEAEKKAIVEAIQIEETAAKKQSDQLLDGELSEEEESVTKFTFEGKDYLRDEKNVVYDYNSQEEIGVWTGIMIELYDTELQHATEMSLWDKYEEKPKPSFTGQCVAQRPLENGTGTKPVYYAVRHGPSAAAARARACGIKKSLGQVKTKSSREPEYHMTKVARDWAS